MIYLAIHKQLFLSLVFIGLIVFTAVNLIGVNVVPVVVSMTASEIDNGGTYFTARVIGRKIRKCEYESHQAFIRKKGEKTWSEEAYFEYLKDRTPDSTKPEGWHDFGYWQWNSYGNQIIEAVKLVTQHDCHGNRVFTTIGPFSQVEK